MNKENKCIGCSIKTYCKDSKASWIFFAIGLIATIAMRIIEPLNLWNRSYGVAAWYIGVLGFFIFFTYKSIADKKRSDLIEKEQLVEKINSKKTLENKDYDSLSAILCSLKSKKDRLNFILIAVLSILAILIVFIFDMVGLR